MNKLRLTGSLLTRLLGLWLACASCVQSGYAQQSGGGNYPTGNGVRVREVDGSPNVPGTQTLVFPNGSLTRAGQTVTVTVAGGTTINSTNGQLPYRVNSTTFGDSGIAYSSGMIGIQTTPSAAQLEINSQSTTRPGLKLRALSGTAASQEVFQSYDASGVLRNTFNADGTFRVYNTYTDASNYERFGIAASATKVTLDTSSAGTGSARLLEIGTRGAATLAFFTNNTDRWIISSSGHFLAGTDNTYDIGASGATRPRDVHVARNIITGSYIQSGGDVAIASGSGFFWTSRSFISSPSDGVIRLTNNAQTDFSRLQFGGTTSSFPSLKRSSAELQVRLADDSAFAAEQSLYIRYGSGTPEGAVTAPVGAIYSRTDGGAGTSFYVKESGSGTNTGWVAK